jgi:hypothetical protein
MPRVAAVAAVGGSTAPSTSPNCCLHLDKKRNNLNRSITESFGGLLVILQSLLEFQNWVDLLVLDDYLLGY